MSLFSLKITGTEQLARDLIKLNRLTFEKSANDTLVEMFNRASQRPYTPIDTGELRLSRRVKKANAGISFAGIFGYAKEYAPHVEYGHRLKGGGFVAGQYFLRSNVEHQRPIYKQRLKDELRKGGL